MQVDVNENFFYDNRKPITSRSSCNEDKLMKMMNELISSQEEADKGYTIDTIESRLEWKVEALLNKSGECNNWCDDKLYQPADAEEEHGASLDYPIDPNKSKECTREEYYQADEGDAYFETKSMENQYEDLPRENDESYDLTSTKEDGEEDLKDFYCCMTYQFPNEEVPENYNFRQHQQQEEAIYQGNPRTRPSPAPYDVYEDWGPVPSHRPSRFQRPYPRRPDTNLNCPYPRREPYLIRFSHQVYQDNFHMSTQQRAEEEKMLNLISQLADLQDETMKMLHEKLDKIDFDLSRKMDDIVVRVRSIDDQRSKDAEALERRLHCLEEQQERHLKSAQDNAINIRDLANEVTSLTKDHESTFGVLFNKDFDTSRRVQKLENRAYEAESKIFGLEFEQNRFGEAMSEKFTFTKENHKLLKEIESEIKEKNQDLADKIEDLTSRVAGHKEEEDLVGNKQQGSMEVKTLNPNPHETNQQREASLGAKELEVEAVGDKLQSFSPNSRKHSRGEGEANLTKDCFSITTLYAPPPRDLEGLGKGEPELPTVNGIAETTRRCREEDYAKEPPDAYIGERPKRACLRTTHFPHPA
ncbi:PREDICTED: uncharacterized protein LOC104763047 [Camelina sativa]|uniref:Uncharacterized protein LOC104763047 n=1 Tax=Camelina sativa TaxID=90675 RepID=A0ABM0XEK1_CAMSA|nr:PREDICTED: uncharacterized protein LOC104763047 [Camelina sativa]